MANATNFVQKSSDGTAITGLKDSLIFDNGSNVRMRDG